MKPRQLFFACASICFSIAISAQTTETTSPVTATETSIPASISPVPTETAQGTDAGAATTAPLTETNVISTEPVSTSTEAATGTAADGAIGTSTDAAVTTSTDAAAGSSADAAVGSSTDAAVSTETPAETGAEAPLLASAAVKPTGSSANALKKANLLYNEQAYSEAIPYYEKARQADNQNKLILSNLGDCYRLTNNTIGQVHCYGELVRAGTAEPKQELYYAQALVTMGEAEKAKPFFEKYTADARGKEQATSLDKRKMYTRNSDAYNVSLAPYNSLQSDMCAVKFNDAVVFASSRERTAWIKRQQGWTNGNYLGLYTAAMNGSTIPMPFMNDLESKFNDGPICFSSDYNTVYFTRNNSKKEELAKDGTYKLKILEANLDQNGFSMVKLMPFNDNNYNFAHPSISPDGYTLYFSSDKEGGQGGMDLYMSQKDSSGTWGEPVNLGDVVNTAGNETFPFIATNGLLYFSSDGHDGLGGLDIYETRMKDGMPKKIYNMGEPVNSNHDDFGIYIFEDNKTGFISSNRKVGGMDDDIYNLAILREVKRGKDITLVTKDKATGELLPQTKIVINGDTVNTDPKGEYVLNAEEEATYRFQVHKYDYFDASDSVSSTSSTEDAFTKEILLEKDPKLFLRGLITDSKTNELLEGATIKLTDITTNAEVDVYTTTASGDYFKFLYGNRIGDNLTYLIKIEKPGYLPRTTIFSYTIDKPGEINLNEKINLSLGKVAVGMDLAKMIDLKPIYFDMGKSVIRTDAAMELDKIVQIMNEYPNMYIELGAHTDCRSSAASNLKLSTARAKASAGYIVKKGINKMRITGKGYGETKLLNNCACEGSFQSTCPEEEHAVNRRTEFVITKLK
jgi:outer membrane protein OmpA-like peptidoglycan-associated protein/tetratricopeptide (TPR) repeat protein